MVVVRRQNCDSGRVEIKDGDQTVAAAKVTEDIVTRPRLGRPPWWMRTYRLQAARDRPEPGGQTSAL
jgi:hypothetical protein